MFYTRIYIYIFQAFKSHIDDMKAQTMVIGPNTEQHITGRVYIHLIDAIIFVCCIVWFCIFYMRSQYFNCNICIRDINYIRNTI